MKSVIPSLCLLPVLLFAFAACGGSGQQSAAQKDGDMQEKKAHTSPILVFHWTGGVAGFQRSLELYSGGNASGNSGENLGGEARAEDKRMERGGHMKMAANEFDSLVASLKAVVKLSDGPYKAKIFDDFHFTIDFHPDKDGVNIHVEGDGSAFPENYQPVLRRLMELTSQALEGSKE